MTEERIEAASAPTVSEAQLRRAEAVEAEEGALNVCPAGQRWSRRWRWPLLHLYAAVAGAWPFTDSRSLPPAAALRARRLRAGIELPPVPAGGPISAIAFAGGTSRPGPRAPPS